MRAGKRRLLAWLVGIGALVIVAVLAVKEEAAETDVDRKSYEAGYHSLGDAYVTPSEDERAASEARCEELWGAFPSDELAGLNKDDWVEGCADYVEGRDSRF